MKKYIDCDGVILDTETGLFDQYYEQKKLNRNLKKVQYLQQLDWIWWIKQAKVLENAIEILKSYNPIDIIILTKVYSLGEALAKINYFRENKLKNDIVIVPNGINKSSVVEAKGNILVDDSLNNLEDWKIEGGIPVYYGSSIGDFQSIYNLEEVLNPAKLEKVLRYYI